MSIPYEQIVTEDLNLGHGTVTVTMPNGGTDTGNKIGLHTFSLWYNVADFGADRTGVADALTAIDAALTAAGTSGTIYLPEGTYALSAQPTIPAGVGVVMAAGVTFTGAGAAWPLEPTNHALDLSVISVMGGLSALVDRIAIGTDALANIDLATEIGGGLSYGCLAIGAHALAANTTGHSNIAIGTSAGKATTTGFYNVFIGMDAGVVHTTGEQCVFIGNLAGYHNTTGSYNLFIGVDAGWANTTASYNLFIGVNAGYQNTTGDKNVFMGLNAGASNTTASYNLAIGYYAGTLNVTGANNSFVGFEAGYNSTADQNTFVGSEAGIAITTGGQNTFVGAEAGVTEVPANEAITGAQCVFIGCESGPGSAAAINNAILIGYRAHGTASNQVVLGNASITSTILRGVINAAGFPTYANNAAAVAAGLVVGDFYRISAADTLGVVHA